ncbi:1,3-propanediol dehydrogenase [bioreactor metagenome]|uniref:1,3-propanediol dehydrogenase n=1 Tax=bioreactor metagenome TaxID=1076179 RepID=A0A645B0N8_9ZZZZ
MFPAYYEFFSPVKICSGHKALNNLPYELDQLGATRPLIITDPGVTKAGLVQQVIDTFADSDIKVAALYDQVPPDSSSKVVNEIVQLYNANQCDSLVAVGGGSVIDTTKGVNIVITEGSDDLMKFAGAEMLKKPTRPFIVIPTTSGTGSEVTCVAVISDPDRGIKMSFTSNTLYPRVAILDPRMTLTLPPHITAATGMDALTHAVEAYISLQKNPMSDSYSWKAIQIIRANLVNVVKNGSDKEGRLALANASTMAGIAFSNAMVGVVHNLGHATGGVCHVPHGVAMNIFLPVGLEYNLPKAAAEIGELLLPLGGPDEYAHTPVDKRAERVITLIRAMKDELYELCKLPRTLKEAGVAHEKLPEIAAAALKDGASMYNVEDIEYKDALMLAEKAFE